MSRQMQQTNVPPHLRQYTGSDRPAFVPPSVQRELAAHMEKVMPEHLKQYAGAYVAQNMMPTPARNGVRPMTARPPVPERRNLSHTGEVATEQADATTYLNMFQSDQQPGQASGVPQQSTPSVPNPDPEHPDYSFIMEPPKPPKRTLLPGNSSMPMRLLVAVGGLVVIIVLFAVIKSAFSGSGGNYKQAMLGVVQEQYALKHYAGEGVQSANSGDLKNFAVTAQASLASEESQAITYLSNNGYKVNNKQIPLKASKATDEQLAASVSASNFDATFSEVMKNELTMYQQNLKQAYTQVKGTKGRALLNEDYKASQLLLEQLGS